MTNRVKERREQIKMTQEELSAKSGVSRATISCIENDALKNSTSKTLLKIAAALDSSIEELFFIKTV